MFAEILGSTVDNFFGCKVSSPHLLPWLDFF